MKTSNTRVAISGFGGLDIPHAGASVARALRAGWQGPLIIDALVDDSAMTGAWQPGIVDTVTRIQSPLKGDEAFYLSLINAQNKLGFNAFIPCLEQDIAATARLADRLHKNGINTLVPNADKMAQLSPLTLASYLHQNHIAYPHSLIAHHLHEVAHYADHLGYPVLVKGAELELIAHNAEQVLRFSSAVLERDRRSGVLLQARIAGEAYSLVCLINQDGERIENLSCRKLAINSNGHSVCSSIIDSPDLEAQGLEIIKKLGAQGPITLDLIHPTGGSIYFLEGVKSCLPDWCMLAHWANKNLAVELLKLLTEPEVDETIVPLNRSNEAPLLVRSITEDVVRLDDMQHLDRHGHINMTEMNNCQLPSNNNNKPITNGGGLRVAVTGTSSFDLVNSGIGVARALRSASDDLHLIGLCYGTFDSGAYNKELFDVCFQLPITENENTLFERFKKIIQMQPIDVLIPCLDGEIPFFIKFADELKRMGVHTLLPNLDSFEKRSKTQLFSGIYEADQQGFIIPETISARNEDEVLAAVKKVGLPAVVKGPISFCVSVIDESQAKAAWHTLYYDGMKEVLIQPMISGPSFAVATVCNHRHEPLTMLTVKKLSLCPKGSTWRAMRLPQVELEAAFARFLKEIKWVGPVEGEFIRDEILDRFYLIEINPRFTGWIYYSATLGSNHPQQAVHTALGEEIIPEPDKTNLVFVRSSTELRLQPYQLASFSTKGYLHHNRIASDQIKEN
ncbi:ATP-grasp domain-containing protein [Colwellia psychrerythraea]|uniref:ATP-grasp domain-containing protein n=1 Tax=Colwellia psychrerythraea (strain 34H / ATCC BAA-681) TaxID=167879 RepID=Q480D8_COLP3|nr:ATP-grasp domain-containing protein [Colwellia psychrerythraea]AAZ27855.1 hypothetical protein CPS_2876 [Colwellia psychrerythraea 34H]